MENVLPEAWPQFNTATIQGRKYLFKEEKYKDIIINTLMFLVEQKKVKVNDFIIMDNHFHLIWQAIYGHTLLEVQTSFKKHTSKQFLTLLENDGEIENYKLFSTDRKHNFWKRNSLGIELFTKKAFLQKLNYIHNNPVFAGVTKFAEDCKYSSASFYQLGVSPFDFIEDYRG